MTQWTTYVKKYAAANGLTYRQALSEASAEYKKEINKARKIKSDDEITIKKKKNMSSKSRYISESESEDSYEENEKYSQEDSSEVSAETTSEQSDNDSDSYSDGSDYDSEDYYDRY